MRLSGARHCCTYDVWQHIHMHVSPHVHRRACKYLLFLDEQIYQQQARRWGRADL